MNDRKQIALQRIVDFYLPGLVFLVAFSFYLRTMADGLYWGDGIELTTVSHVLGIAHPTGYPLFTILGKAFQLLPIGTVAYRMNLMTALFASLSCLVLYFFSREFFSTFPTAFFSSELSKSIVAAIISITFALTRIFWQSATSTEVYSLNILFFAVIFLLMIKILNGAPVRMLYLLCFITGLSFGNHMMTILCVPSAIGVCVYRMRTDKAFAGRQWIRHSGMCVVLFLLALSVYAYMPIRANARPPMNWGNPDSAQRFFWSVTGGQFKQTRMMREAPGEKLAIGTTLKNASGRFVRFVKTASRQIHDFGNAPRATVALGILFGALVITGIVWCVICSLKSSLCLLGVICLNAIVISLYTIPDIDAYYLPSISLFLIYFIVGVLIVCRFLERKILKRSTAVCEVMLVALPIMAFMANFGYCDKSGDNSAEMYGLRICAFTEPNSLVITNGDNDIYVMWYMQLVEKKRPDLVVFGHNFITSPWYSHYFLDKENDLVKVDMDYKSLYAPDEEKFLEFVRKIIRRNIDNVNIYSTEIIVPLNRPDRYQFTHVAALVPPDVYKANPFLPSPFLYKLTNNPKFSKKIDAMQVTGDK